MNKQELLNYLKITRNDYNTNFYNISKEFFIPSKLRRYFNQNEIEECFINVAGNILCQINILLGGRIFQFIDLAANYDEFVSYVGKSRVNNLKSAVYEEIKFRIISNSFPEFENSETIMPSSLQHSGTKRDYTNIENYLCPTASLLIINSAWNKLELPEYDKLKDLVEVNLELSKKVEQNSSKIKTNTELLLEQAKEFNKLDRDIIANREQISLNRTNLENHLQNTNKLVGSVRIKNNEQDEKLTNLSTKVTANENNLNSLGGKTDALEKRIIQNETKISNISKGQITWKSVRDVLILREQDLDPQKFEKLKFGDTSIKDQKLAFMLYKELTSYEIAPGEYVDRNYVIWLKIDNAYDTGYGDD